MEFHQHRDFGDETKDADTVFGPEPKWEGEPTEFPQTVYRTTPWDDEPVKCIDTGEPVWSSVNEFHEQREQVINELWEDWADGTQNP